MTASSHALRSGLLATKLDHPPLRDMAVITLMAALASWLSIYSNQGHATVATLWLMNGLVLGTLLTYPTRDWPAIIFCAAVGNIGSGLAGGLPLVRISSFCVCNLIEIAAGLAILYKPGDPVEHFTERKSALRICSGVLLAPLASCVLAGAVNYLSRQTPFWETIQQWYVAHALGLEIMTPLALALRHDEWRQVFSKSRRMASTLCLVLLIGVSVGVFCQDTYPFLFMVFPPLVLAVFVLGFFGMSVGLFCVAVISLGFTLAGHGPFVLIHDANTETRVLIAQAFLLTSIVLTLPVAVALAERNRLEQRLLSAQDQLRQLSLTDQLTGLPNRRMFDEFSQREWKRAIRDGSSISVIMIDIDLFKTYNDRYGHQAGDKCLSAVAAAIGGVAARPGDLTARYGGEEFIVMLAGTPAEGCEFLAERIRKAVEALQLPHASSTFGKVTVSLGAASLSPKADTRLELLIEAADNALYEAKGEGRNKVMSAAGRFRQAG